MKTALVCAAVLGVSGFVLRAQVNQPRTIASFCVGIDETVNYPSDLVNLPDEHTTFIPFSDERYFGAPSVNGGYLVFASSKIKGGTGGTVALETFDFKDFQFATADGYAEQVMVPPVEFTTCDGTHDAEFDENYSAPGSVIQDPRLPPGNFIMFYEAENHCPGGVWQQPYYATIGYARSFDGGRTWPAPENSEFGGPFRHPVIKGPDPEPASEPNPTPMGDAIPSAFLDRNESGQNFVYVAYGYSPGPGKAGDGQIRVARASLDDTLASAVQGPKFMKWNDGGFTQRGIGGVDSGVLPAGCPGRQMMAEINYNDDLGRYLMIFVCNTFAEDGYGAWYYSTATSLDAQDWTTPQQIAGSRFKITSPCSASGSGAAFDGFYPSTVSPGALAGHTKLTGRFFFLNGCDTGPRTFMSRTFTIAIEP